MAYSITLVVIFVGFHKIFVEVIQKADFHWVVHLFLSNLSVLSDDIYIFLDRVGKEVVEQPLFMTKDIRIWVLWTSEEQTKDMKDLYKHIRQARV